METIIAAFALSTNDGKSSRFTIISQKPRSFARSDSDFFWLGIIATDAVTTYYEMP